MKFVSTRGQAPALSFSDAVLTGLARDGGLYVPEIWPTLGPDEIESFSAAPYASVAKAVLSRFASADFPDDAVLEGMIQGAYATFRHRSVTPLVEIAPGHYLLELFHGPTLAFKDIAMQLLARLMDHILVSRGQRATIVGATSGDTGSAAIEAFRGRDNLDIFILHPEGRTSEVQRRQMTTVLDDNVHNIAIQGTFDDCQKLVKGLFNNLSFRDAMRLSGVNSINWGRIVAQIVYYVKAAAALGAPSRQVAFSVPTGNFGDIFAGYGAMRMGLPIERFIVATNTNDILRRALDTGRYEVSGVVPTASPSMDIEVSSNFERLLFEATGRDADAVGRAMSSLSQSGGFSIPETALASMRRNFSAATASEAETFAAIARVLAESHILIDPHTGVGVHGAASVPAGVPVVTLATAHPAKFPAAVKAASGREPLLPPALDDLYNRVERFSLLPNDLLQLERFIAARSRAQEA